MFKSISKNTIAITLAITFATAAMLLLAAHPVTAHEGEDHTHEVAQASSDEKKTEKKTTYNYVAQSGDTYSQFARKAIQTYGKTNKVNLSQAQIIYAETTLTLAAGSPVLVQGESRSIDQSAVKDVVEKAGKLTDAQKNAWKAYTVGVDFNTDKVGEKN